MAPPRRPGLTVILRQAPRCDPMMALIWSAVPLEHCTPEMLAYRKKAEPLRVRDNVVWGWEGMPRSDHAEHPTICHWQAGGVVLFGYSSLKALK